MKTITIRLSDVDEKMLKEVLLKERQDKSLDSWIVKQIKLAFLKV